MAHYAKVVNGVVETVIVAEQEFVDNQEGTWVQTSYNTSGGVHYNWEEEVVTLPNGDEVTVINAVPSGKTQLRKNFAGVGNIYDSVRDAFYAPEPSTGTWTLNEDTCFWEEVE